MGKQKKNVEEKRRGEEEEEEEEEEHKKKMKERSSSKAKRYGTLYIFAWITWISCIDTCLWVVGCRKPNPRMSSCMEIIINPFVFLGFCYEKI